MRLAPALKKQFMSKSQHLKNPGAKARLWNLGKYIRLSKEDLNRGNDDSNSVANQKKLLDEYWLRHLDEFCSAGDYIDDGYTGTDTKREGFQRLLADITARKINCVLVKDLSRLSRNYSDAGSLIENLFVQLDVRFISLAEGVDSYLEPDSVSNILVPIINVMNDNFCYQTSKKVRQVFDYKRRNGEFIGSFAAYGYLKDPANKHALLIDEEAAEVVGSIYSWFLQGLSKQGIVQRLNKWGILCPSEYKKSKGLNYQNPSAGNKPLWSAKTVGDILKNRLYAGDLVQGRQRMKSYKIHTQEQVPESQWFIVENTHQPIIERENYEKVQGLLQRQTRTGPKQNKVYLFSGFLRCADCGKALSKSRVKGSVYYFCRTYKDQSKAACTKHSLKERDLERAVLFAIQEQIYLKLSYSRLISALDAAPFEQSSLLRLEDLRAAKEKELAKISSYKQSIYQDWKDGAISYPDYLQMREDYEERSESLRGVIGNLLAERGELAKEGEENPFLGGFRKDQNISYLNRELLNELVEGIRVSEKGMISIRFKFSEGEPPG